VLTRRIQIVAEAIKVLNVVEKNTDVSFSFQEHLFGGVRIANLQATAPLTGAVLNRRTQQSID